MESDEELLAAWRGGDRRAGNALFSRHLRRVRRFFANKAREDADELLQTTFERCVAAGDRYEGRSSFATYLLGIAFNVLREHYRKTARNVVDIDDLSLRDLGAGPSTLNVKRDEDRRLLDALRTLPLILQVVVELHFWEDLTAREIGEVLGIPANTASSRLRLARARLAEILGRDAPGPPIDATARSLDVWARDLAEAASDEKQSADH